MGLSRACGNYGETRRTRVSIAGIEVQPEWCEETPGCGKSGEPDPESGKTKFLWGGGCSIVMSPLPSLLTEKQAPDTSETQWAPSHPSTTCPSVVAVMNNVRTSKLNWTRDVSHRQGAGSAHSRGPTLSSHPKHNPRTDLAVPPVSFTQI